VQQWRFKPIQRPTVKRHCFSSTHLLFLFHVATCSCLWFRILLLPSLWLQILLWSKTMLVVSRNLLQQFGLRSLFLWFDLLFVLLTPMLVFCVCQLQDIFRKSGSICKPLGCRIWFGVEIPVVFYVKGIWLCDHQLIWGWFMVLVDSCCGIWYRF
jgi:hypothetical protein